MGHFQVQADVDFTCKVRSTRANHFPFQKPAPNLLSNGGERGEYSKTMHPIRKHLSNIVSRGSCARSSQPRSSALTKREPRDVWGFNTNNTLSQKTSIITYPAMPPRTLPA